MPEVSQAHDSPPAIVSSLGAIAPRLEAIAELARACASAFACFIAYHAAGLEGLARSFSPADGQADPKWDAAARAVLGALARKSESAAEPGPAANAAREQAGGRESLCLSGAEVAALCGRAVARAENVRAVACALTEGSVKGRVVLLAPEGPGTRELEALCGLACTAALAVAGALEREASRAFWRKRATDAAEKYARAQIELKTGERVQQVAGALLAQAGSLKAGERFAALGEAFAACGPFDRWILAVAADGKPEIVACAPGMGALPPLDQKSALSRCFAEQVIPAGAGSAGTGGATYEDRVFGRPYLCVPFDGGAIVLASRTPADEGLRAQVEATARRLSPLIRSWILEAELERERALVRRLALRMFAAVDEERARIARDLHDDQAQLLTAARLALEGGGDEARGIFKRLEEELRRRVRRLRPATLGRATLEEVLATELERVAGAGIRAKLLMRSGAAELSRPVQQLCYQVAREALSNVVRHSGATRVRVVAGARSGAARISVVDNGGGIGPGAERRGTGLAGLRERLELMGGSLKIRSRPGETRLVAEIPELAR